MVVIVFRMARITFGRCLVLIQRALMTPDALRFLVIAFEKVLGIAIMFEKLDFPVPFGVTALASITELSLVLILLLMAGVAVDRSLVFVQVCFVTGFALARDMPPP